MNDRGDTDDAQECLAQFLEQQPDGEHRELVEAALQGDLTTEADATDPVHQAAFVEAQGLAWGENPARAVELLAPMAEAYPDSPQVWFVLGAAHRRAGNLDEAERCLRRTVLRAAEEPFAWWELAQTYLGQRLWKQAEQAARKALELDPENPAYLLNLGQALIGLDDREAAREVLEEANSLVPDDPEISKALEQAGGSPAR
jgi:Flp pilus assembly protein TadD